MKITTTKIIIIGAAAFPTAYIFGMGLAGAAIIFQEEKAKRKVKPREPKKGPKPEQMRNPYTRSKVRNKFDDIVENY